MTMNTNPARGMRDFLPAQVRRREYVIKIIKEVYESYGFEPLETPSVENLETLTGKYGEEGNQLIYKILKRGEKLTASDGELSDLALRYDLTVPLARVVANRRSELPKFFKRYQIQPVWRADRPARGRFREFYQCDVDAIGSSSMIVEAELCAAVSEILTRLGFDDFVIKINDRRILDGFMNLSMIEAEKRGNALVIIDKLDKIEIDGVRNELTKLGIAERSINALFSNMNARENIKPQDGISEDRYTSNHQRLDKTYQDFKMLSVEERSIASSGVSALKNIVELLKDNKTKNNIFYAPSLARGLSYYTGAIFEIDVGKEIGSLGGGGRYDGLIGMFGKEEIPACGFSLGLERILVVMDERGMFPESVDDAAADALVMVWDADSVGESLALASELRREKLRVLVYPQADKAAKQFKYADQINVPFVCILGENESKEGKVTLKNMRSGEQETILRTEIAAKIKAAKAETAK